MDQIRIIYSKGLQFQGIDLDEMRQNGRFFYIDALDESVSMGKGDLLFSTHVKITKALNSFSCDEKVLVLDSPDIAIGVQPSTAYDALSFITNLRSAVQSTVITMPSDVSTGTESMGSDDLRTSHQQLLLTLAHQANLVLSARVLDTGQAKDVSGVLSITAGGMGEGRQRDQEFLYHVETNRAMRVWQRGAEA